MQMPLRDFLLRRAGIAAQRCDELVTILQENWVDDMHTLKECLLSLESKLPAAAFVAISRAIEQEPSELGGTAAATAAGESGGCGSASSTVSASAPAAAAIKPEHEAALLFQRHQEMEAVRKRDAFRADVHRHRELVRRLRPHWWILSPGSRPVVLWEGLVALGCIFAALVTPFEVGLLDLHDDALWRANRAVDGLFGLDVLVSLCVLAYQEAPEEGGRLVWAPRQIATRYVRSGVLVLDVLAAVPWELVLLLLGAGPHAMRVGADAWGVRGQGARLVRLAALVRLLKLGARLGRLVRTLRRWERPRAVCFGLVPAHTAVLLPCVLGGLALLVHWLACLWAYAGRTARTYEVPGHVAPDSASSWIDHAGLPADVPPHVLYAAALQPAVAAVLGGVATGGGMPAGGVVGGGSGTGAGAAAAAAVARSPAGAVLTDGEAYVHALMLCVGGAAWAAALAACCCAASAAWPQLAAAAAEAAELEVVCAEQKLPRELATQLDGYLDRARAPLAQTATAGRVLAATSSRLRGDTAHALARPLLERVPYFGRSLALEVDFLASVALALERAVTVPRDLLAADRLTILESGRAIRHGRILLPSTFFGEAMVVALPALRDSTPAIALSYVSTVTLSRDALVDVFAAGHYPRAAHAIRHAAVRMALCRAVLLLAARLRESPSAPREGYASPILLSAQPMRELLLGSGASGGAGSAATGGARAEALAAEAATTAATAAAAKAAAREGGVGSGNACAGPGASAPPVPVPDGQALAEARLHLQLEACGGRLEVALDALAARWPPTTTITEHGGGSAAHRLGTSRDRLASSRDRQSLSPPRAGRTLRMRRNHHHTRYPAAPTFVVPRNGLPADHMSHELPALDHPAMSC